MYIHTYMKNTYSEISVPENLWKITCIVGCSTGGGDMTGLVPVSEMW